MRWKKEWRRSAECPFQPSTQLAARLLLASHSLELHGDSTLRGIAAVLIKFVGLKGSLEKKDANKGQRITKRFELNGMHLSFRFDFFSEHLLEEDAHPHPGSKKRVIVAAIGVHQGATQLIQESQKPEAAENAAPGLLLPPLLRFFEKIDADDNVSAVVLLLQSLECPAMASAPLPQFRAMYAHCSALVRYVNQVNAILTSTVKETPSARKVILVAPPLCEYLRPRTCDSQCGRCTKDGIHLRTRYLRLAADALLNLVNWTVACL